MTGLTSSSMMSVLPLMLLRTMPIAADAPSATANTAEITAIVKELAKASIQALSVKNFSYQRSE